MNRILYIDIHDIKGQYPIKEITDRLRFMNVGIKKPFERWIRCDIPNMSFINTDINEIKQFFRLREGNAWIVKKSAVLDEFNISVEILFCAEKEFIPEQVSEIDKEIILHSLNKEKKTRNEDYWVSSNAEFMFCYHDPERLLDNRLIKLEKDHYWLIKQSAMIASREYNMKPEIMKIISELIAQKAYIKMKK
jgi:hypothetical protein